MQVSTSHSLCLLVANIGGNLAGIRQVRKLHDVIVFNGKFSATETSATNGTPTSAAHLSLDTTVKSEDDMDEEHANALTPMQRALLRTAAVEIVNVFCVKQYRALLLSPPSDTHVMHPHRQTSPASLAHRQRSDHPFHFMQVIMLGEHLDEQVRTAYVDCLRDRLKVGHDGVPVLFGWMLVFCGAMSNDEATASKLKIVVSISREQAEAHRRAKELAMQSKSSSSLSPAHQRNGQQQPSQFLPEMWLFDFLYALSYHPSLDDTQFTDDKDKMSVYDRACTYIEFMLDAILAGSHSQFGLILAVLSSIKRYEDVLNPARRHIYKMVDLAGLCKFVTSNAATLRSFDQAILTNSTTLMVPR